MRNGLLSYVGLMLLLPLHSEAQGRPPLLERAVREAAASAGSSPSGVNPQSSSPASSGRDSLVNGTVIGFAAGAALGIGFVHAVRDSDLGVGSYAYGALIFGGMGAGAGLGIDALFHRSFRVTVRSPRTVALGASVSRKNAGLHVIKRW